MCSRGTIVSNLYNRGVITRHFYYINYLLWKNSLFMVLVTLLVIAFVLLSKIYIGVSDVQISLLALGFSFLSLAQSIIENQQLLEQNQQLAKDTERSLLYREDIHYTSFKVKDKNNREYLIKIWLIPELHSTIKQAYYWKFGVYHLENDRGFLYEKEEEWSKSNSMTFNTKLSIINHVLNLTKLGILTIDKSL